MAWHAAADLACGHRVVEPACSLAHGQWQDHGLLVTGTEEEADLYAELLKVGENPLTVAEEDGAKKRYKAYRKWLHGKSFFKQQPLD